MIFTKTDLKLYILDCADFTYGQKVTHNTKRMYSALSLRSKADADIMWGGKTIHLSDRSLTYFPANLDYTRRCTYDNMTVIHFDVPNYLSYDIQSITPQNYDELYAQFRAIRKLWKEKLPGYRYAANALLYRLFETLSCSLSGQDNIPDTVADALDIIHRNYTDSGLTISDIAGMLNISEVYFRRLFCESMGVSPKKYIVDLRLENAKTLLNTGSISVAEVAERSGFGDVKHFSTVFKKRTGYQPSRQKYK